jgi:hypothetical protein
MTKPFKHTDRDPEVLCANDKCAMVNGIEGVTRQPIKRNVIARAREGQTRFECYYCSNWRKTGRTRKQELEYRAKKKGKRTEPKVLTAGEEV